MKKEQEEKKQSFIFRMTKHQHRALKIISSHLEMSMQDITSYALQLEIDRIKEQHPALKELLKEHEPQQTKSTIIIDENDN